MTSVERSCKRKKKDEGKNDGKKGRKVKANPFLVTYHAGRLLAYYQP
jgi:hypothetical protein